MKTEPLLGAAAFGAVAAVLYNLINTLIAVQSPAFEGLGMELNCFVGLVIALVTGFLYATLHRREPPITSRRDGASNRTWPPVRAPWQAG